MSDFTIRNYYTSQLPIDDGIEGAAVQSAQKMPIRIRRFTVAQLQVFQRGYAQLQSPTSQRYIYRKPDGDEQAMREIPPVMSLDGTRILMPARSEHIVPDAEVEQRRLGEMSPETRAAYDAAGVADDTFMSAFCSQAITEHVWLAPGDTLRVIVDEVTDGERVERELVVKDGAGLVQAFGGNLSMLVRLTRLIHQENTLSPEAKKALRLLSGSTASSPRPASAGPADGATPAAIASSAGAAASVSSGAASADQAANRSGSTET